MKKTDLTLLRGGLTDKIMSSMEYVSGYITDTRLMGVMCMHIHWISKDNVYDKLMSEMEKNYPDLSASKFSADDLKDANARFTNVMQDRFANASPGRFANDLPGREAGRADSFEGSSTSGEISFGDGHYTLKKIGDRTVINMPDDYDSEIVDDDFGIGHDEFGFGTDEVGPDFHQFFYLDAESYGLENYKSVRGNDYAVISVIEQTLAGGLGGKQVEINEMEAAAILQEYAGISRDHGLPLPENHDEFDFLLKKKIELTPAELRLLATKQCCHISTSYQAANYFMMRIFGHDYKAAEFLMGAPFPIDIYADYTEATLLQNTVEPYSEVVREEDRQGMAFEFQFEKHLLYDDWELTEGEKQLLHPDFSKTENYFQKMRGRSEEDHLAEIHGAEKNTSEDRAGNAPAHGGRRTDAPAPEDRKANAQITEDRVTSGQASDGRRTSENAAKDHKANGSGAESRWAKSQRSVNQEGKERLFRCTSLIESMGSYYIIATELRMKRKHVIGMRNISKMRISAAESAMILAHSEFITIYEIVPDPEMFTMTMLQSAVNAVITGYECGTMFMIFNPHNDHVNKKVFKLHNDVYGLYFVSNAGQLLVSSSSRENIYAMEHDLRQSQLSKDLVMSAKYEFHEPVLLDFINSDFDSFEEFLDFIKY